jgi:hypothetical protein
MNEIPRIKIYPYGSYVRLQSNSGLTVKVYPKNKQTEVPREISEPPKLRIRKLAQSESEADKYRKIIELKNSSQDLQRLNDFFSDISKSVYEKGDASAIRFLQFLKSPQGDYLTSHLINKALFNEAFKIQKEIQIFDEGDSGKYSDQKGLRERSGFIATQESQKPEEDIPDEIMNKMASEGRAANYIINSINLVNHLGDLTLDKLAHKLIEKIDDNIDTLNKKYPWISAPKLVFANLALRNSNDYHGEATNLGINENSLNLSIEKVLEIFKQDLDETREQAKVRNPKLVKLLNKFIDKTQFRQADATNIRDFYMYASIKGYQEEANQVLMRGIAAQNEDPRHTDTINVYILDKLFAFAVEEKLIENPQEFIQDIQDWREGARLPKDFSHINTILNPPHSLKRLLNTIQDIIRKITPSKNAIIDSEENDAAAATDLVAALIQIQKNLGIKYFEENDLDRINEAMLNHLKAVKEKDFDSFTQLFDQIINMGDKKKYPTLGSEIFEEGLFFYNKPFGLFDLSYLLGCFTDKNSKFNQNLFKDYDNKQKDQNVIPEDLPSVYLNIKNFDLYNKVLKTNTTDPLPEGDTVNSLEAFQKKLQMNELTDELISSVIDKLPLDVYSSKEIAIIYFLLCDEGHISNANHLLNRKIEQLNTLKESQEKYHEYADILELFGYAKSKGLIREGSLNLDNKVLKTYSKILENPPGKLEKGFNELLEIIQDEKINPHYTIILLNQLTGSITQDDNDENTSSTVKQKSHSVQAKVKQALMNDEQKELLTQALKQRVFLNDNETEVTQFQIERQKEKRVNELADLLELSNQLLSLKIFDAKDIEHLQKDYGDWNIIEQINKEDISGIFNASIQERLFSKIPEYKLDNENDVPLYILIGKAFESTRTLGKFKELSELVNETLKETPIFPGDVKNDLKLSLMISNYLLLDNFFKSSNEDHLNANENSNSPEDLPQNESQTDLTPNEVPINRLLRKRRSRRENLSPNQRNARKEERARAKIRDRDFQGRAYAKPSRLLSEITRPSIYQAPALDGNKNLLETAFYRIFENYKTLKRRYEDFPAAEIDPETLQLARRAENRLFAIKVIDKKVFADKMTLKV